MDKNKLNVRPTKGIFLKSLVIGALISVPSLTAFFTTWVILGDKMTALIIGVIVHFIGMGFSLKISKRLFKINQS